MEDCSNIVCKFSLAKLKEDCDFSENDLDIFSTQVWGYNDKQRLLNKLAELMLDQRKGLCVAKHFRGILLEILKRTQNLVKRQTEENKVHHLNFSATLSHLLPRFPYILSFVLNYFAENGPFFGERMDADEFSIAIETAYRLLRFTPSAFCEIWNWGGLCDVNYLHSNKIKQTFLKTMSIVLNCNNIETVGLLTTFEDERLERFSEASNLSENHDSKELNELKELIFTENDFSEELLIVSNMLVPRTSKTRLSLQELVMVPSMVKNIQALSVAFVSGKAVLISGAVGSGKTSLVEHFASHTGRDKPPYLFKVQLGDQTDSKAFIGSYCCSDVPGEFVWRPGILTRAVREGRWLLLEDIDCAPMDVISVLIPLLESRVLSIPGKENVKALPGFQLFATQRVGRLSRGVNPESSMLEHLWSKVTIEPLTQNEMEEIVKKKFPNMASLAQKLVDIFSLLSSDLQFISKPETKITNLSADKRLCTVRDFMKWCRRLNALSNGGPTSLSSQDIFLEVMDCFCATISNQEMRMSLALAIGAKLNINKVKIEFLCSMYKPTINVAPLSITIGRITLNREQVNKQVEKPTFAFTRHSLRLLESLAVCVSQTEPVLLVGETGTGKTSAIQYLATLCNRALLVVNMSQQSDSTDLIGGFKPMEMKHMVAPVRNEFETLFCETFSRKQNVKFLSNVQHCFGQRKWEVLFQMMLHTQQAALERLSKKTVTTGKSLSPRWKKVGQRIKHLHQQLKHSEQAQMFSFMEGALVKAIKRGDWVLLDEINLASPETLECLNGILESQQGSVVVLEKGDAEPVVRHEQFRMFACMNPANDVGKKNLPAGIRNRFTEMFVGELQDIPDLKTLVYSYLQGLSPPGSLIDGIVSFYLMIREQASQKLTDGSGNRPYYSLRTLCRALKYASKNPHGNILRSVYEGFCISFLTQLDRSSHNVVETLLQEKLLGQKDARTIVNQPLRKPNMKNEKFLNFEGHWICQGNLEATRSSDYVFTTTVKDNLKCLARIVSGRDFPVLIQGETSVGKTSLINWLAKASGNYCVRINNHEHTDIQEYLGCYTSDASGKLVFKEGILVDAMRKGYWIILDELNLAPTDVLEALNRLLDDNRELFIPEIQEHVKAHPKFMLFATQNPPGHYGGRKVLSRAFRNRFVELHFEELPSKELETILHKRCNLPMSYSKILVNIMLELQVRRRGSTVFSGKQGFITLRDLFRWAERYSKSQDCDGSFFDWNQQLAEDGYLLLAGRCRNTQETLVVQEVIEKHMKRKIDLDSLFGHPSTTKLSSISVKILGELVNNCPKEFSHVVFTYNMRRLAVLVARALQFNEPVLLVGETGCGKTTICQVFAAVQKKKLHAVNCHLHTETSDFLGGLRPARRDKNTEKDAPVRLFEWCDGCLVMAMKEGGLFLADEISLADDSVLERLNSVLEPERTLILAEKGSSDDSDAQQDIDSIVAKDGFQLLATMNPGGDYGKKELSPALRNRFTEIWCPSNDNPADMIAIIEHNVLPGITLKPQPDGTSGIGSAMIEFIEWFKQNNFAKRYIVTVRDFLSWVKFINVCTLKDPTAQRTVLEPSQAYIYGAFLVFLDALGLTTTANSETTNSARELCSQFLSNQLKSVLGMVDSGCVGENEASESMETEDTNNEIFSFGGFCIPKGPEKSPNIHDHYALNAPTTSENAARVMRAMQLHRPILLEGSPGVGKTSLVSALAKASGHRLVRINLSEQTDISDLFGADLPVEGSHGCQFSWCDGPLLLALKSGSWVVLDELNLASQSVLEGLNACFDHRGEIFIPELGKTFQIQHERTKFFACQNPLSQGGGRKGLPKSFLNRFTRVYVESLTPDDLLFITKSLYPKIDRNILRNMIFFNAKVYEHCVVKGLCSKYGGSWEFNLRDIFRWCDLMIEYQNVSHWNPVEFVQLIYVGRMRTNDCRNKVWDLCFSVFGENSMKDSSILVHATPSNIQIGKCLFPKCDSRMEDNVFQSDPLYLLHRTLKPLENLLTCLKMNWLALLVGPKSSCKTSLARLASQLTGTKLDVLAMNSSIDTTELLGGYEQADLERHWTDIKEKVKEEVFRLCRNLLLFNNTNNSLDDLKHMLKHWFTFGDGNHARERFNNNGDSADESNSPAMLDRISQISNLLDDALSVCQRHDFAGYSFEKLKDLLKELHAQLIQSKGNPHVSGQFQWMDGQLVKALKNGHWLLIDNVNFCSPSVLDRLNGLLEPGGVLSINERGVVDGEVPVVKPHPDFRLIFAMDSKHGEISRAMRNRGVEIFLMQEDCDTDDLHSILYSSGCRNYAAIQTLTNIHDRDKEGSLLRMVNTGSLTSQLWQRGIELDKSLVMSLNQVHGVVRNSTECKTEERLTMESRMLLELEQKPTAVMFQKDAIGAIISRHSIALGRITEDANKSPNDISTAVDIFLEWSSKDNWQRKLRWLKSTLVHREKKNGRIASELDFAENCLQSLFASEIVSLVYRVYQHLEVNCLADAKLDTKYQPLNIRVNGPLYKYICCKIHGNEDILRQLISCTNRLYLLWAFLKLEAQAKPHLKSGDKFQLKSPLWLSFAYVEGHVKLERLPHRGIGHIYPLLHSFEKCIRYVLESSDLPIDDNDTFKLWVCLKQYKQLLDVCTQCYSQDENYHVLFDLHWKSFRHGALDNICKVLNDQRCGNTAVQELLSVRKRLNEICKTDNKLAECHWNMISDFEHPNVFVFQELCILWAKLVKLHACLVNWNPEMIVGATLKQSRTWLMALVKGMMSLVQLRERKISKEESKDILVTLEECVNKIKNEQSCDDSMDENSFDVVAQCSEISIQNESEERTDDLNEVYCSEIIQDYCSILANFAYTECINVLELVSLGKKSLNKIDLPYSEVNWSERLTGYYCFCVKYLRKIPLNVAVIQHILQSDKDEKGFPKCSLSLVELANGFVSDCPNKMKLRDGHVPTNVACSSPDSRCVVKTFEEFSITPVSQYFTTDTIRLVDLNKKIVEYNHLNKFFWLNQHWLGNLDSIQSYIEWKSLALSFVRLLHSMNSVYDTNEHFSPNNSELQSIYSDLLSLSSMAEVPNDFEKRLQKYCVAFQEKYARIERNRTNCGIIDICLSKIAQCFGSLAHKKTEKDNSTKLQSKIQIGLGRVCLGMLQSTLLRPLGNVDPVEENNFMIKSMKREIDDLSCELKLRIRNEEVLTGVIIKEETASNTLQVNPHHVNNLVQYRTSLECELGKTGNELAYRPDPPQFRQITGILDDFSASVGNYSDALKMLNDLGSWSFGAVNNSECEKYFGETKHSIIHLKTWVKSVRQHIIRLKDFVAYQDILGPYISGLVQIVQGSEVILSVAERKLKWKEYKKNVIFLNSDIKPCLPEEIVSCLLPPSRFQSVEVGELLSEEISHGLEALCRNSQSQVACQEDSIKLKSRIQVLALHMLKRAVSRKGYTTPNDIHLLESVINFYKTLWLSREEERKSKQEDSESLYKFKTKTYCNEEISEEQQNQEEVDQMFTSFDQEYNDLNLDNQEAVEENKKCSQGKDNVDTILDSDMGKFYKIHQFIVSAAPNISHLLATLDNEEWKNVDTKLEDLKIGSQCYGLASTVIRLADLCDAELSGDTTGNHIVMSSLLLKYLSLCESENANKDQVDLSSANLLFGRRGEEYDIYHDSNLKEVVQVLPILTNLKSRLLQLLEEWPEHPTLLQKLDLFKLARRMEVLTRTKQLCQTIDRIISFPITSPVIKILNGLEILLQHSQEWESNASRHVSIRDNLDQITQMIIRWRKLELSCWSSLLQVCEVKIRERASHWWFHIHRVIKQFSDPEDGESANVTELINVLQQFMESSSLGEFSERLRMLVSFVNQTRTVDDMQGDNSSNIRTILWNVYCYYKQFESQVESLIQKAKAPIEKELKDFIKIIKWKDINYWAMKETSSKSHYTLLKLVKKYQVELSEGIDGVLRSSEQVVSFGEEPGENDTSCYNLEPTDFLSPTELQKTEGENTDSNVESLPRMFLKMRKLTSQKLKTLQYQVLSASLNEFIGEIVSTTHYLQKLEVGEKTGKERTQFCKHIHVLKKRALADLFKRLGKIGLSYRKGILLRQQNALTEPMMVDCSDIMRTMRNVDKLFKHDESSNCLQLFEKSLHYYQKCIARSTVMNKVLTSPSKDLTAGDVDRMKGFVEHLREITQRQRENISTVGKLFSSLSLVTQQLTDLARKRPYHVPPQGEVANWTCIKLDNLLNNSLEISEKLLCFLDACPNSKIDVTMNPCPEQLSPLSKCCKEDEIYISSKKAIEKFHEAVSKIKSQVYSQTLMLYHAKEDDNLFIATWSHVECLESSFKQLEGAVQYLDEFITADATSKGDAGFGKLVLDLRHRIVETCGEFIEWRKTTFKTDTEDQNLDDKISSIRAEVTSVKESILLSFQKWYKRETTEKFEETEDDKYFVEGLDNELLADISILDIRERTKDIKSLLKYFSQAIDELYTNYNIVSIQTFCEAMISILPCMSQYMLLVRYYFHQSLLCHKSSCKLNSVLLAIFSELLQKGFCLPPDQEELEGEGATSFEDAENCGIGEGQGSKDVSDQIEDEEQVLGGEQQKSDKTDEGDNNQIAEEENGIEMSEDFEGETHDVEKGDESGDDDRESENESENLEQKMGDVDGADETLDEKLWADSDGEDNDNQEGDTNERGTGAQGEDQNEIVAKEENQGSNKENENKPKEEMMNEDRINELAKDDEDLGNLDENFADNKNEMKPDDAQPEDMEIPENLDLDTQENNDDDGDEDDDVDGMDEATVEEVDDETDGAIDKDEVDKNSDAEIGDNCEPDMIKDEENVDHLEDEDQNQVDTEQNEDDDESANGEDWKTESETKEKNVQSVEDQADSGPSYGATAGNEQSKGTENDESMAEEYNEGTDNSMSQQSGLDSTESSTTRNAPDFAPNEVTSIRKQLNKSRADRSLGSSEESASKKLKVADSTEDSSSYKQREDTSSAELFEHISDESEMHDRQVYDAATAEQQKQQEALNYPSEVEEQDESDNMKEDWELPPTDDSRASDGKDDSNERGVRSVSGKTRDSPDQEMTDIEISTEEQDQARKEWEDTTSSVFMGNNPSYVDELDLVDPEKCRGELEELLSKWHDLPEGSHEEQATTLDAWHKYEQLTSTHSLQLCEQLRMVLEPSIASKLKGDYRTGKRLNMRKVIPYIASQYRKDKIWLRRTKKSKRQYQILLAIDDSSSMSDNQSKQLAFESLAVITNALTRLETGEISICSFGEDVDLLHPFHETFTEHSGAKILRQFRFEQKKTKVAQLLNTCTSVMTSERSRVNTGNDLSQLLLIVSDGRGIFLEGVETVQRAVRKAKEAGIFSVFVILDNPTNRDSILDIKFPIFRPGQSKVEMKSYIEQFPFPFYIVLRDISSLPDTLCDSLRQWFELVTNV